MKPIEDSRLEEKSDISEILNSQGSRGRRLKFWIASSVLVLLAIGAVYFWLAGSNGNGVRYITQPARRGNLTVTVTATGTLEPTNQVDVGSELSGTIKQVEVTYNDHVKKDQVLVRLDTSKLQAQALQSKASLESAQAKVLQAQATVKESRNELARLKHLRELSGTKGVSQHDLDSAEATLARAIANEASCRADVAQAKATLEINETDLSKAIVRSPINGIVLTRSVEPGQTVAAQMTTPTLVTLAEDLTKMKLLVDVDEADVGAVREGQEASFTVDACPDRRFPARIIQVRYGAKTTNSVVTYKAALIVDNTDMALRPGMTATAEIIVEKYTDAVLVPNAALRFSPPIQESKNEAQGGGFLGKILPHPPHPPSSKRTEDKAGAARKQKVWTLRDGEPVAVPVSAGATDGAFTVVREGAVEPDMPLAVTTASIKP
ncbi:MAG: efflux RND transporter periplasmic adaptor subunit [Syntrophobacter sp.]